MSICTDWTYVERDDDPPGAICLDCLWSGDRMDTTWEEDRPGPDGYAVVVEGRCPVCESENLRELTDTEGR